MATWVGVDPGGRDTGIVLRLAGECFGAFVVTRAGEAGTDLADWEAGDWAHYLGEILGTVELLVARAAKLPRAGANPARVAVEGLTNPGGRAHGEISPIRPIDVTAHPTATVVAPGGHGSGPTVAYPAELVGARERAGRGRMRHARSAWDVAGVAPTVHRLAEAGR